MYYATTNYLAASFFYALSQGLDAVDGVAARHFNQCTKFGSVLDMVTDRVSTLCLLTVLAKLYPDHWFWFAGLTSLDIFSHWFQMYAKLLEGAESHKGSESNFLLKFYYSFPYLLICCVGNEGFFICSYLLYFTKGPILHGSVGLFEVVAWVFFPICVFKNFMNLVQLYDASCCIAALDVEKIKAARIKSKK
eukprot:GILI01018368.1.p1 GENE.GILI01018368.1~~GILI01018368.1.p1  ORF type:complete len:224 (+),score=31.26 GILI01018368.1:99-674(+)